MLEGLGSFFWVKQGFFYREIPTAVSSERASTVKKRIFFTVGKFANCNLARDIFPLQIGFFTAKLFSCISSQVSLVTFWLKIHIFGSLDHAVPGSNPGGCSGQFCNSRVVLCAFVAWEPLFNVQGAVDAARSHVARQSDLGRLPSLYSVAPPS